MAVARRGRRRPGPISRTGSSIRRGPKPTHRGGCPSLPEKLPLIGPSAAAKCTRGPARQSPAAGAPTMAPPPGTTLALAVASDIRHAPTARTHDGETRAVSARSPPHRRRPSPMRCDGRCCAREYGTRTHTHGGVLSVLHMTVYGPVQDCTVFRHDARDASAPSPDAGPYRGQTHTVFNQKKKPACNPDVPATTCLLFAPPVGPPGSSSSCGDGLVPEPRALAHRFRGLRWCSSRHHGPHIALPLLPSAASRTRP